MILALSLCLLGCCGISSAFQTPSTTIISSSSLGRSCIAVSSTLPSKARRTRTFSLKSTQLDKEPTKKSSSSNNKEGPPKKTLVDPSNLSAATHINNIEQPTVLDLSSYENSLLAAWDDETVQRGFDWEIEKLRRHFAGLRQRPSDGAWVRTPSVFDFLVTHTPSKVVAVGSDGDRYEAPPKPVNILDVVVLVVKNTLNWLGFGPSLGMAAVPDAIIQKYEGSFFSFIKGVLGGDLQTLAGGPLFLLLAKYYQVHGPIFNLSFGPKSFLVISDPVMARHILRDSSPEQYCKGMLAEILEPIMGDGLIPADPKIWKVSCFFCCACLWVYLLWSCCDVIICKIELTPFAVVVFPSRSYIYSGTTKSSRSRLSQKVAQQHDQPIRRLCRSSQCRPRNTCREQNPSRYGRTILFRNIGHYRKGRVQL